MSDEIDPIAEAELRKKQLHEQLAAAPVVVVSGVVAPNGAAGAKSRGDELWTMMFTLDGWRVGAADVQPGALHVRRKVTDEELKEFRKLIVPYNVIRIRARVAADSPFENTQAQLEEYLGLSISGTTTGTCSGGTRYRLAATSRKARPTRTFPDDLTRRAVPVGLRFVNPPRAPY